jgi:hypothetical protein
MYQYSAVEGVTMAKLFPMNPEKWRAGQELEPYVDSMALNQSSMRRRLTEVRLTADDKQCLDRIEQPIHVLVMTEEWCADSLMNIPIVARIVEAAPQMDLRIFTRSEADELNDFYIGRGNCRIPVVTFFDEHFQEIGTWMERSQAAHGKIQEWIAAHPEGLESPGNPELSPEERRWLVEGTYGEFIAEMEGWYADCLNRAAVDELIAFVTA